MQVYLTEEEVLKVSLPKEGRWWLVGIFISSLCVVRLQVSGELCLCVFDEHTRDGVPWHVGHVLMESEGEFLHCCGCSTMAND